MNKGKKYKTVKVKKKGLKEKKMANLMNNGTLEGRMKREWNE